MVWWPSLWGSRQADSNAAYRLAPSRWDPASAITQHEAPGGSGAGAAAGLNGARRTSPISLLLSMQCRSAPLSAASEKRLTPQRLAFGFAGSGIFVPVAAEEGFDELGALLDARKTIDAEIARHRRLADSQPPVPTVDTVSELEGPAAAEADAAPDDDERADAEGAAAAAAATPSPAGRSRKRARPDEESDDSGAAAAAAAAAGGAAEDMSLSLSELDLKQDSVTVVNNSPQECSLDGCSLRSSTGGQEYNFPQGTRLAGSGGRLTVWSGAKNKSKAKQARRSAGGSADLFWTARYIWNDHGDGAILLGPEAEELDRITATAENSFLRLCHFYTDYDHFTKTGSGQTQEKLRETVVSAGRGGAGAGGAGTARGGRQRRPRGGRGRGGRGGGA